MAVSLIDFVPLFGALLSLLIVVSIILRAKTITPADYFLLAFLFTCFLSLLHKFLNQTGYILEYIHLTRVNHLLGILRPPLFFLYVYFAIHPKPKHSWWQTLHFIPFIVLFVYLSPYLFLTAEAKYQIMTNQIASNKGRVPLWYLYWGLLYSVAYLVASFIVFKKALLKKGFIKKPTKQWIALLLITHVAFLVGALTILILRLDDNWEYLAYHIMTVFIMLGCVMLLTNINGHITEASRPKYSSQQAVDGKAIFQKALEMMQTEKLFLNDKLRIKDLATKLNVQEYLLSQIINDEAGVSFVEFINQFRIEEAKHRLTDPVFAHLTIEAIGAESGFNTKASFYSVFKKHTGLTPKEYKLKASK